MPKQAKLKQKKDAVSRKTRKRLLTIPFTALFIKLFIIMRIEGFDWFSAGGNDLVQGITGLLDKNYTPAHIWYGADGENYLRGLVALVRDGFFSTDDKLSYWPAGYPLLMLPLLLLLKGGFFFGLALLQSLLYAVGCAFFVDELRQSRLSKFAIPIALFLTFNPTLALNTIAIGYELPTVSLNLIAIAAMMRNFRQLKREAISIELFISSFAFSLASLMQPRLLLIAFFSLLIWSLAKYRRIAGTLFLATSLLIVAIAPGIMIFRNSQANGFVAISTNLGTTMNIGAGPESTGGYTNKATGVQCPSLKGNAATQDAARVKCVINWYLKNPTKTIKLAWNKSIYFWSPWFGPAANGTMARNPWRINHPFSETIKTESGFNLIYGTGGKFISWAWILTTIAMLFYGFFILWQAGNFERYLSIIALSTVLLNWLISLATIGDNRFRIPSMGMSLFLQVVGFTGLFIKKKRRFAGPNVIISWPGLHWKSPSRPDNLPS